MSDRKPNSQCKECGGTGRITLFTSSCECDCVNRKPIVDMKILDEINIPDFGNIEVKPRKFHIPFLGKITS